MDAITIHNGNSRRLIWLGSKITADGDCSHEIKRLVLLGRKAMTNLDSTLKNRDITLPTKVYLVKALVFPVVMYGCELDHNKNWVLKNWCFWTVVLEKTLESPLECKEIQPVHPKGNQSWIFIGRTDAEAEAPILWPSDMKWHWKRFWCLERLITGGKADRDDMVESHHWHNGHEFEQTLGDSEGRGAWCVQSMGWQE